MSQRRPQGPTRSSHDSVIAASAWRGRIRGLDRDRLSVTLPLMFPIRDHNPSEKIPVVVLALIAMNIAVFLFEQATISTNRELSLYYANYALIPAQISDGAGYTGLVTHMFLHGGIMHLGGNMLFLWIFGDNLEEEMGHVGFLLFYLVSGLGAGLIQYAASPYSPIPMVGASGAIAGVMGGYLLFYPKAKVDILLFFVIIIRIIPIPAWIMLGVWFGLQVVNGAGTSADAGGVAYWAHAGGFVVGLILAVPAWLRAGGTRYWDRVHGHPPHPEARYDFGRSGVPRVARRTSVLPRVTRRK